MGIELGTPLIRHWKTGKRQHWRNRRSEGEDKERKARKKDRKDDYSEAQLYEGKSGVVTRVEAVARRKELLSGLIWCVHPAFHVDSM